MVAIVGVIVEAAAIVTGFCVTAVCGAVEKFQDDRLGVKVTFGDLGGSALVVPFVFIAIGDSSGNTCAVGVIPAGFTIDCSQCSAYELSGWVVLRNQLVGSKKWQSC